MKRYIFANRYIDFIECCRINGWDKRKCVFVLKLEQVKDIDIQDTIEYGHYWKNPVWGQYVEYRKKLDKDLDTKHETI